MITLTSGNTRLGGAEYLLLTEFNEEEYALFVRGRSVLDFSPLAKFSKAMPVEAALLAAKAIAAFYGLDLKNDNAT